MEWLEANYMTLVQIITLFISLVIFLIKILKQKNYDYLSTILLFVPTWIQDAEKKYSIGSEKLAYVLQKCLVMINSFNLKDEKKEALSVQCVSYIESILSCPQKKEVNK